MKSNKAWLLALFSALALSADAQTTHYVSTNGSNIPPFASWQDAATNIQNAVDVAVDGDTVLVTNGLYDTGGVVWPGAPLVSRPLRIESTSPMPLRFFLSMVLR
jgi:hypothetical protein